MPYQKAEIRLFEEKDEALLFGLASLDRGADERTLGVLESETVFVAEVGGTPAGYVALERRERAVCVDQLFVSPEHEAEGVGTQLLEYAEGYAIWQGAEALQIVVESDNERALTFYQGRGFMRVGDDLLELLLPRR
ncbi:MAG TPA: GNAT family N-acetyltransferase [Gaiellaceae bacterium]|jgi:GNAT superfamily N-acetyltransferase